MSSLTVGTKRESETDLRLFEKPLKKGLYLLMLKRT